MKFEKVSVKSSVVEAVGYNEAKRVLRVWLNSGDIYDYLNVPKLGFESFLGSSSKGIFYNQVIKRLFSYKKLR